MLAPAGTPREIVEHLNFEVNRTIKEPDLIAKFAQQGMSPAGGTPAAFQKTIETEVKLWIDIAHRASIKAP